MNKIIFGGNRFRQASQLLQKPFKANSFRRNYANDDKEKKEQDPEIIRQGILHDKQQSVQEESYFHKEELQQLKELKKRMIGKKEKKEEEKKNE